MTLTTHFTLPLPNFTSNYEQQYSLGWRPRLGLSQFVNAIYKATSIANGEDIGSNSATTSSVNNYVILQNFIDALYGSKSAQSCVGDTGALNLFYMLLYNITSSTPHSPLIITQDQQQQQPPQLMQLHQIMCSDSEVRLRIGAVKVLNEYCLFHSDQQQQQSLQQQQQQQQDNNKTTSIANLQKMRELVMKFAVPCATNLLTAYSKKPEASPVLVQEFKASIDALVVTVSS